MITTYSILSEASRQELVTGSLPQLDIYFSMTTDMEDSVYKVLMLVGLAPSNGMPETF